MDGAIPSAVPRIPRLEPDRRSSDQAEPEPRPVIGRIVTSGWWPPGLIHPAMPATAASPATASFGN